MSTPKTENKIRLRFTLNGRPQTFETYPMARLLDVIRKAALLTGTKEGCGEGECGACSVIMSGELVNSCLVPAIQAEGADVVTIEGIAPGDRLHAVQEAFIEAGGAQCGACTPGMIVATIALLRKKPNPTMDEIREGLAGNLCRCTGYTKIFDSVLAACKKAGIQP